MDAEYPYADGLSRRRLLYRLPTVPQPRRLLLISGDADGETIGVGWEGPVTLLTPAGLSEALLHRGAQFDAVALPGLMSPQSVLSPTWPHASQLLSSVRSLLVPGGVLVGHLHNVHTLRRLATWRGFVEVGAALARRGAIGSAAGCRAALLGAGYTEPECWYVQPSIASPMGLIPAEPVAARAYFLRSIRSAKAHYSGPAYVARLLVAALGLGGMQQPELFFWAKQPC